MALSVLATILLVGWQAASDLSAIVGASELAAARAGAVQLVRPLLVVRRACEAVDAAM